MDVTNTQQASPSTSQTPVAQASRTDSLAADFDTFLQMLTAQARYQDPLEPIDSSEYAAQLAQFSMVEQQVKTNEAIESLTAKLTENGLQGLTGWMGMEVRAPLPLNFDGEPVNISPRVDPEADRAVLVVRDLDGREIDRLDIPASNEPVTWDGKDALGANYPSGAYMFEVESWVGQDRVSTYKIETYGLVDEVQTVDGIPTLVLSDGSYLVTSAVTGIRELDQAAGQ